ncbi:glycosyltransferase [Pedobacter sp. MC2016-15]|uniref:glycosyltransferase n=1 Tax=Pedobacter sp. MC2016-15 TaxID=2994473 RepID=UPI0022469363|nr:glycosyltransferase [Pedobacter sp. MC2016-15]MCX2477729.1 glycosyltransferase [Pedobacter sp. MC2016-15]
MASLSVIVPVYNKELYIDSSIMSILNQSYTDLELILVNDGSTDDSGKKCDYYANVDSRVRVFHQQNGGVSSARNKGLNHARGAYIGFVDCDDTLEPDMYEILMRNAKKHEADISVCGVQKFFPDKVEVYYGTGNTTVYDRAEGVSALLKKKFLRSVYDKIYKAELAKSAKFEGRINEDIYYNFLVFMKARKSVFDDQLLYNYIIRDNSVSMSKFSVKWMDTIALSQKIVAACKEELPELNGLAREFDFITHISLLNLLILSGKDAYLEDYRLVVSNLRDYAAFAKSGVLRKKHEYAYRIFNFSPPVYEQAMKMYCRLTDADVSKKV